MKVLIVHCTYKYGGGEDTVVGEEFRLLKTAGVNVDILEFQNEENTILKLAQLPFNFSSYKKTSKKLKQFRPDIVHIHNLHFAGSASVLYALNHNKIPFVMTLHNYRLLCPSAMLFFKGQLYLKSIKSNFPIDAIRKGVYKNSRLLTFWLSLTTKLHQQLGTWNLCSKYIVLTEHARKIYLDSSLHLDENKVLIKPNFYPSPAITQGNRSNCFLYVGRLSEEKGLPLLLKVFSAGNKRLKIAGDGPLRQDVQEYCKRFENIEYLGLVKKDELPALLTDATALVFPSICFEGMPLTIIEAFATGTPVIASKLGAMESMIVDGYNGLHFEAGSESDFEEKVTSWYQMAPTEKAVYSRNARSTYERSYTPEENLEKLLSIYQSVINGKNTVA